MATATLLASPKFKFSGDKNKGNTLCLLLGLENVGAEEPLNDSFSHNSLYKRCSHGYKKCSQCSTTMDAEDHVDIKTKKHMLGRPSIFTFQAKMVSYDRCLNDGNSLLLKVHLYVKLGRGNSISSNEIRNVVSISSKRLMLNRFYTVDPEDDSWHAIYSSKSWVDPKTWKFDLDVSLMMVSDAEPNKQVNQLTAGRLAMILFDDEETTDVELVGFDGTVRAHGNVLAAVSPVMRSAFYDCELSEKRDRRLSVPDASVHTLQLIKQFAYKGFVEAEPLQLVAMLPVASRFMLDDLARVCTAAITDLPPDDLIPLLGLDYKVTATKRTQQDAKLDGEDSNINNLEDKCPAKATNTEIAKRSSKRIRKETSECDDGDNSL